MHVAAESLGKRTRRRQLLDDVSFEVRRGQVVALRGPNGSGKSLVIKRMLSLTRGTGTCRFDGASYREAVRQGAQIGVSLDSSRLNPSLSSGALLRSAAASRRIDASDVRVVAESTGVAEFIHVRLKHCSVGMRQRVSLAMMGTPSLLVLDEPTNGFDAAMSAWLVEEVAKRRSSGAAVVLASHHDVGLHALADTTVFLNDGRVVSVDS